MIDPSKIILHYVENTEDLFSFKRWLGERKPVLAIDTETSGIIYWRDRVRLVQFGDGEHGWSFNFDAWGGAIIEAINEWEGKFCFHNAAFDVKMLEKWCSRGDLPGVKIPRHRSHDTLAMASVLEPHRFRGLKPMSERWLDYRLSSDEGTLHSAMSANGWNWETVPNDFPPYWVYGGMDAVRTALLYETLYPRVMDQCPRAYELELATTWVVLEMARRGVEIDTDYAKKQMEELNDEVERIKKLVEKEYNVSPGQDEAVIERLSYLTDYKFTKLTESGNRLSLDAEVLEDVVQVTGHPLAAMVLARRRKQRLVSAYLRKLTGDVFNEHNLVAPDGRVHPDIRATGARTGRQSVGDPSLQNLPRAAEVVSGEAEPELWTPAWLDKMRLSDANSVRNSFVATNRGEDHRFVLCDFDQIEARIAASYSADPGLLKAFESDSDFFTSIASEIYQDPNIKKSDPRRQLTKNTVYSTLYGGGPAKIAATAHVDVSEIYGFLDEFNTLYPGLRNLMDSIIDVAKDREKSEGVAYVKSPLTGRIVAADSGDKAYVLMNYLIQSSAAEVMKMKMLEANKRGLGPYMVLSVHDELMLDTPLDQCDDVKIELEDAMRDLDTFSVPLTVGADIAWAWGTKGSSHANTPGVR